MCSLHIRVLLKAGFFDDPHAVVKQRLPAPARALARLLPRWAPHLFLSEVFDGDIPYLYKQSRSNRAAFAAGREWVKEYYLPGQSDRCVAGGASRSWGYRSAAVTTH